jgi:molybdopterin biosynthesis enzyme
VVGVASLALPFPRAQRSAREQEQPYCPLAAACTNIMRQASVAALELGYAPGGFRALKKAVERWVKQVDILLLVGGSHHGPNCLGLDVLRTIGEVRASGYDAEPGGALSAGLVDGWPVVVCPGGLPDAIAATVLAVRPLAHKYLTPVNFAGTVQLRLDNGSQIRGERTRVAPVRFGWDDAAGCYATRFTGEVREPWMDFIRAQALIVLEGGRDYNDGEFITAHTY